jgi:tetraacyldisaccharide 4'-kinase
VKFLAILLLPFAGMYAAVMRLRNWAYDRGWKRSHGVGVPVISVGNITVGGTGKTPMAEFLLGKLLEMGYRPAYLSRGYGRSTKGYFHVTPGAGGPSTFGDEALQVATRFPQVPVAVCGDRVEGARRLLAAHQPDVLVLDDAFQHRRIHRDLDLVMVDVSRKPWEDRVLPMGRLREPLAGLQRADVFVFTKFVNPIKGKAAVGELRTLFPGKALATMTLKPRSIHPIFPQGLPSPGLSALKGMPVVAFSGLGNNAFFRETLESMGAQIIAFVPFPDHHPYGPADLEKIFQAFEAQKEIKGKLAPALILTTEKDYFRLKEMAWMEKYTHLPIHYMEVGMVPMDDLAGWEQLEQKLKNITGNI